VRWHWLRGALAAIYAQLPDGAQVEGIAVTTREADGSDISHLVTVMSPGLVRRLVLTGTEAELDGIMAEHVAEVPDDPRELS
jgi:hypothetical protein